jgi:hypothetical protein
MCYTAGRMMVRHQELVAWMVKVIEGELLLFSAYLTVFIHH